MDLLVEKLDGSRYYLSQYKVLITEFEESAPSVTRNSTQLDQHNGNIDFGGWHTDKTINITGYYRADDMDEEEMLREKLYALLSDPNGYYITQLKTTPSVAMERPGETSGGYYDKLKYYPSHKRFLVYTEAPEMELVGNVGGTLLYKLSAEFKTMKLPYGETVAEDINLPGKYDNVPMQLLSGTSNDIVSVTGASYNIKAYMVPKAMANGKYTASVTLGATDRPVRIEVWQSDANGIRGTNITSKTIPANTTSTLTFDFAAEGKFDRVLINTANESSTVAVVTTYHAGQFKLSAGTTTGQWTPILTDMELDVLDGTVAIPYTGTVPCNQLEQGFSIQLTATGSASSLSFEIDDTELTYSNAVAAGDVISMNGFSYTQNGLSIVSKTNKAYFILQPDKPNRITCNVPGKVRILGFQNLYA